MALRSRLELEGPALVFATTTVVEWIPVFRSDAVARIVLAQLADAVDHYNLSCFAFGLMPHHLHLLVGLPQYRTISKFMQGLKILSSKRVRELGNRELESRAIRTGKFQLWRPRFDDLVVESEQQLAIKMGYIHDNPVRAGLVERAVDWPYSSAAYWLLGGSSLVPIDQSFRFQHFGTSK